MRSAEYDRDAVLRNAMEAFRAKGYAKTTMQELVAATGLHPAASMPPLATSAACCWRRSITMWQRRGPCAVAAWHSPVRWRGCTPSSSRWWTMPCRAPAC